VREEEKEQRKKNKDEKKMQEDLDAQEVSLDKKDVRRREPSANSLISMFGWVEKSKIAKKK
jgi:hypothetical protein